MTRAVFAAGVPAPEVFDEVTLQGRFGIVLQRLDGPTLLQLSRSGAMSPLQVGAILAALAISVHKTPAPPEVLSLYDWMDGSLPLSVGIPKHIATGILALIERLPPGDGAVPLRPYLRQRDHDGGWAETHRLVRYRPRARRS